MQEESHFLVAEKQIISFLARLSSEKIKEKHAVLVQLYELLMGQNLTGTPTDYLKPLDQLSKHKQLYLNCELIEFLLLGGQPPSFEQSTVAAATDYQKSGVEEQKEEFVGLCALCSLQTTGGLFDFRKSKRSSEIAIIIIHTMLLDPNFKLKVLVQDEFQAFESHIYQNMDLERHICNHMEGQHQLNPPNSTKNSEKSNFGLEIIQFIKSRRKSMPLDKLVKKVKHLPLIEGLMKQNQQVMQAKLRQGQELLDFGEQIGGSNSISGSRSQDQSASFLEGDSYYGEEDIISLAQQQQQTQQTQQQSQQNKNDPLIQQTSQKVQNANFTPSASVLTDSKQRVIVNQERKKNQQKHTSVSSSLQTGTKRVDWSVMPAAWAEVDLQADEQIFNNVGSDSQRGEVNRMMQRVEAELMASRLSRISELKRPSDGTPSANRSFENIFAKQKSLVGDTEMLFFDGVDLKRALNQESDKFNLGHYLLWEQKDQQKKQKKMKAVSKKTTEKDSQNNQNYGKFLQSKRALDNLGKQIDNTPLTQELLKSLHTKFGTIKDEATISMNTLDSRFESICERREVLHARTQISTFINLQREIKSALIQEDSPKKQAYKSMQILKDHLQLIHETQIESGLKNIEARRELISSNSTQIVFSSFQKLSEHPLSKFLKSFNRLVLKVIERFCQYLKMASIESLTAQGLEEDYGALLILYSILSRQTLIDDILEQNLGQDTDQISTKPTLMRYDESERLNRAKEEILRIVLDEEEGNERNQTLIEQIRDQTSLRIFTCLQKRVVQFIDQQFQNVDIEEGDKSKSIIMPKILPQNDQNSSKLKFTRTNSPKLQRKMTHRASLIQIYDQNMNEQQIQSVLQAGDPLSKLSCQNQNNLKNPKDQGKRDIQRTPASDSLTENENNMTKENLLLVERKRVFDQQWDKFSRKFFQELYLLQSVQNLKNQSSLKVNQDIIVPQKEKITDNNQQNEPFMKSIFTHLNQSLQNYFVVNLENQAEEEKIAEFGYKKNNPYLKEENHNQMSGNVKETKLKKITVQISQINGFLSDHTNIQQATGVVQLLQDIAQLPLISNQRGLIKSLKVIKVKILVSILNSSIKNVLEAITNFEELESSELTETQIFNSWITIHTQIYNFTRFFSSKIQSLLGVLESKQIDVLSHCAFQLIGQLVVQIKKQTDSVSIFYDQSNGWLQTLPAEKQVLTVVQFLHAINEYVIPFIIEVFSINKGLSFSKGIAPKEEILFDHQTLTTLKDLRQKVENSISEILNESLAKLKAQMVKNIVRSQVDDHLYLSEQLDSIGIDLDLSIQQNNTADSNEKSISFKVQVTKSQDEEEKQNFRLQFDEVLADPIQEFHNQLIENFCQEQAMDIFYQEKNCRILNTKQPTQVRSYVWDLVEYIQKSSIQIKVLQQEGILTPLQTYKIVIQIFLEAFKDLNAVIKERIKQTSPASLNQIMKQYLLEYDFLKYFFDDMFEIHHDLENVSENEKLPFSASSSNTTLKPQTSFKIQLQTHKQPSGSTTHSQTSYSTNKTSQSETAESMIAEIRLESSKCLLMIFRGIKNSKSSTKGNKSVYDSQILDESEILDEEEIEQRETALQNLIYKSEVNLAINFQQDDMEEEENEY